MDEATARMILVPHRKYTLTHKSPTQRYNRRSVMTYLGDGQWNARPAAGTQTMPWHWIISITTAPQDKPHSINEDARQVQADVRK